MKRMRRDPVRFDVFAALAHYTAKHQLSIRDDKTVSKFLDAIRGTTTGSLNNDAFVYGFRVQSMFETVVASLGKVQLLKQEDAGAAYHASSVDLAIPDYRIVLDGGAQLLVEVKNFSQDSGTEPYVENATYLRNLEAYATLTRSELLFAVYWHRWNLWTLVPPSTFVSSGRKARLGMPEALTANRMGLLGDLPELRVCRANRSYADRRPDSMGAARTNETAWASEIEHRRRRRRRTSTLISRESRSASLHAASHVG